jgi:hypothetical protein
VNREEILEWLKVRYEGMRRDPLIKEIYPDIDPTKTFEQLLDEIKDKEYSELIFIADFHPKDVQILPLFYTNSHGRIIISDKSEEIKLSSSNIVITIDFDKLNSIEKNIKWINGQIRTLWKYYRNKTNRAKYNITDYEVTYQIGDVVRKMKEDNPKITWPDITKYCLELHLLQKGIDLEVAEKTIKQHYWPRYKKIVFEGGWKHL